LKNSFVIIGPKIDETLSVFINKGCLYLDVVLLMAVPFGSDQMRVI